MAELVAICYNELYQINSLFGALGNALFAAYARVFINGVELFQFTADSLGWAYLGADGAANALFCHNLSFLTFASLNVANSFGGASGGAESAIYAFAVIYAGKIVLYSYCLHWAFTTAKPTANAGFFCSAKLFCQGIFGFGTAEDVHMLIVGYKHYQLTWAGGYTSTAGSAFVWIDVSHALLVHFYGIEYAGFFAVVKSNAAPGA